MRKEAGRKEMSSIDKNHSAWYYVLRSKCTSRTQSLFLLRPCLQCQISPLALFLLKEKHKRKISTVFEKCTVLRFYPFLLCSPFALLWFAGLFESSSQFLFSISSNINIKRILKHKFLCPLFSQHKRGSKGAVCSWWIVSGFTCQHAHSCASLALCTLNAAHHKALSELMKANRSRQHQSSGFQLPPLLQWATFSCCTWDNPFLLAKIALCFRAHKTALGGKRWFDCFSFLCSFWNSWTWLLFLYL